jgi:hypothetical protein
LIEIAIYLYPSYRRSLQSSKVNIQHFKKIKFTNPFLCLWVVFALLDPDCEFEFGYGSRDPIEFGSKMDPDTDPDPHCHSTAHVREMQIRVEKKEYLQVAYSF